MSRFCVFNHLKVCSSLIRTLFHWNFSGLLDPSPPLTPLEMAVGRSLKSEQHIAHTMLLAKQLLDSLFFLPPVACINISCMNLAAKGIAHSPSECVCVLTRESAGLVLRSCWLEMDLEPHATAGGLASCLLPTLCVSLCVSVCDRGWFTSIQKTTTTATVCVHLCVNSLHTHAPKRQKTATTSGIRGFISLSNIQSIKHLMSAM